MTIYEELIQRVSDGEPFHIDFVNRTMKIGKQKIIDNGQYDENRVLIDDVDDIFDTLEVLCSVKYLYRKYKHSLPSERNDNKRQKYFKSFSIDELTDEELMSAERREVAQCKLEGFILCMILMGKFTWLEDIMGKWFYQSKDDPDLVILRSWIENKNNK